MRELFSLVLFGISLNGYGACAVKSQDVMGAWQHISGHSVFEEFDLGTGFRFNSWLHQRPDILDASWQLKNCTLTISTQSALHFVYIVKLKKDTLTLTEKVSHRALTSSYKRVKK